MSIVRKDEERLLGRCMPKGEPDRLPPMRPQPVGRVLEPVAKGRDIRAAINAAVAALQATAPEGHTLKLGWEVRDPDIRRTYTPPEFTADDLVFAHCVNLNHKKFRPKGGKPMNGPGPIVHKPCPAQKVTRHQHRLATARNNHVGCILDRVIPSIASLAKFANHKKIVMQKLIQVTGINADGVDVYTMIVSALPECVLEFIKYERECAVLCGAVRVVIDIAD